MNKTKFYGIAFWIFVLLIALFAISCNGTPSCNAGASSRTNGCDEFTKMNSTVLKNGSSFSGSGWHPLSSGDTISTNSSGQAELNFADCYPGHIYCFRDGSGLFQVENCNKAAYTSVPRSGLCASLGAWYVSDCATEFSIVSGSIKVKPGSTFVLIYFPERREYRELSAIIVLEGAVTVEPVDGFNPTELGTEQRVSGGEFYFTMPLEGLQPIAGLEPRANHPVEELVPFVDLLGIQDWMIDTRIQATSDGVLPGNWPNELGGPTEVGNPPPTEGEFTIIGSGGVLEDLRVQEALFTAVDWVIVAGDSVVNIMMEEQAVDARTAFVYNPDLSRALLEEAGFPPEQIEVVLLYPEDDPLLAEKTKFMTEYISSLGVRVSIIAAPREELPIIQRERLAAGESIILLRR